MPRGIKWLVIGVAGVFVVGLAWRVLISLVPNLTVTSWWRTWTHNRDVGGVKGSAHLVGLAWDVAPKSADNRRALENLGLKVLPMSTYDGHLHAQFTFSTPFLFLWRLVTPK